MSNGFIQRGGLWVLGQSLLMVAVLGSGMISGPGGTLALCQPAGFFFLGAGALSALAGVAALRGNLTPLPKPSERAQLVQHGIYGLVRHPLYLAVFSAALGWSLLRQSWPALGVSLVLAVFFDAKARREERWLRERFPDYAEYQKKVKRFVPWVY
jgi:protein-S-isoprenylcysteine O-methyltransferase Ste14